MQQLKLPRRSISLASSGAADMADVKSCMECANHAHCLELYRKGYVVYCGSTMCKPTRE